jgi:putative hemolysin
MRARELFSPRRLVGRLSPAMAGGAGSEPSEFRRGSMPDWRVGSLPRSVGRVGALEVRLAATAAEVRRAQALRYQVFYGEMGAVPDPRTRRLRRDTDRFDRFCDHLLVVDRAEAGRPWLRQRSEVVGTYRLLRQEVAERHGGFYSEREFQIAPLLERQRRLRFLELGRSCVVQRYRTKRTVELLWRGIWSYAQACGVDVMIGCASLPGTDPDRLALPLSFLHHRARAPEEWGVRAHEHLRVEMNRMPESAIDDRAALKSLPPLVKGYLRLGAFVADGAVVDAQFSTTDVCIVLPVAAIGPRYLDHFGSNGRMEKDGSV